MQKQFKDLTEREILALAIQNEEEDGRIYGEFARRVAGGLSGNCGYVRGDARGGSGAPRSVV
jgi:hypothetical protein